MDFGDFQTWLIVWYYTYINATIQRRQKIELRPTTAWPSDPRHIFFFSTSIKVTENLQCDPATFIAHARYRNTFLFLQERGNPKFATIPSMVAGRILYTTHLRRYPNCSDHHSVFQCEVNSGKWTAVKSAATFRRSPSSIDQYCFQTFFYPHSRSFFFYTVWRYRKTQCTSDYSTTTFLFFSFLFTFAISIARRLAFSLTSACKHRSRSRTEQNRTETRAIVRDATTTTSR